MTFGIATPPPAETPRSTGKRSAQRIGHSDVAFTMRQYVQTDLEADRQVANTLAALIIGGSLASVEIPDEPDDQDDGDGGPT